MKLRIDEILKRKQMTRKQLSLSLNIDQGSLSKYINGVQKINIDLLHEISSFLNVSLDQIVGDDDLEEIRLNKNDVDAIKYHIKAIDDLLGNKLGKNK